MKLKNNLLKGIVTTSIIATSLSTVSAQTSVDNKEVTKSTFPTYINGEEYKSSAYVSNGITYIPIQSDNETISEIEKLLGIQITYDKEKNQINIYYKDLKVDKEEKELEKKYSKYKGYPEDKDTVDFGDLYGVQCTHKKTTQYEYQYGYNTKNIRTLNILNYDEVLKSRGYEQYEIEEKNGIMIRRFENKYTGRLVITKYKYLEDEILIEIEKVSHR